MSELRVNHTVRVLHWHTHLELCTYKISNVSNNVQTTEICHFSQRNGLFNLEKNTGWCVSEWRRKSTNKTKHTYHRAWKHYVTCEHIRQINNKINSDDRQLLQVTSDHVLFSVLTDQKWGTIGITDPLCSFHSWGRSTDFSLSDCFSNFCTCSVRPSHPTGAVVRYCDTWVVWHVARHAGRHRGSSWHPPRGRRSGGVHSNTPVT